ncbi:MAG: hypothetical protein AVDCRST_MAG31-1561, partial [uncultured Sphingomonas sp.]
GHVLPLAAGAEPSCPALGPRPSLRDLSAPGEGDGTPFV